MVSIMPKATKFFDLFDTQVDNIVKAARLFKTFVYERGFGEAQTIEMHELEHEGDRMNHEIHEELNHSFITPFDREDILSLTGHMDDIIDGMHMITTRMNLYELSNDDEFLRRFSDMIVKSTVALSGAVKSIRTGSKGMKKTLEYCIEVNRLENEADVLRNQAIRNLFKEKASDPLAVIKWKEIYEVAEHVVDVCEYVTTVVDAILVKNN